MALDTARKRKSAAWVGQVFSPPTIVPDGSIAQADRQAIGWGYYGIAVSVTTPIDLTGEIRVRSLHEYRVRPLHSYLVRNLYKSRVRDLT